MDDFQNEFAEELAPIPQLTIQELNKLCLEFKELKDRKKNLADQISELEKEMSSTQGKILAQFEANEMKQHRGEFGLIHITNRVQVAQPETMEAKEEFFKHLQDKGVFMDLVSVNSNTLKSWVGEQIEIQEQAGNFTFDIPGLKAPTTYKTIGLKK